MHGEKIHQKMHYLQKTALFINEIRSIHWQTLLKKQKQSKTKVKISPSYAYLSAECTCPRMY